MIYGFSDRLRSLRKRKNLTQEQLANRLKISSSSVSAYEKDIAFPSAEILAEICTICDVKADYLLGLDRREWLLIDGLDQSDKEYVISLVERLKRDYEKSK